MAITDNLAAQWDVNTRGRSDDDFYDHVNGTVEASTGGTVAAADDGAEDSYHYNGSTEWTEIATWPVGLATNFIDSDYTLAARFKMDTVNPSVFQSVFGAFKNGASGLRIHLATETANGQAIGAHVDGGPGTDVYLDTPTDADDGAYHVLVQRRSGNEFSLWLDGVELDTQSVVAGTVGALDRFGIAARTDGAPDWLFDGRVTWAAVWDAAVADADIQALDDQTNPFLSRIVTAATDGEVKIGEAQLPTPVSPTAEIYAISPAFSGAINAATLDPDGAAINITALLSGLTTSAATVTAPDIALLRSTWNAIRLGVAYDIEFSDGTDTARGQITFQPGVPSRFATVGGSPGGLAHPAALTTGDECLGYWLTGAGPVIPETGSAAANQYVAGQATLLPFGYDVSAGQWIEGTVVTFAEPSTEVASPDAVVSRQSTAVAARPSRQLRVERRSIFRTRNRNRRLPGRRIRRR